MLVIKDLPDLLKYLETRKEMVEKQSIGEGRSLIRRNATGQIYAFEESIRAVKALMQHQSRDEEPE